MNEYSTICYSVDTSHTFPVAAVRLCGVSTPDSWHELADAIDEVCSRHRIVMVEINSPGGQCCGVNRPIIAAERHADRCCIITAIVDECRGPALAVAAGLSQFGPLWATPDAQLGMLAQMVDLSDDIDAWSQAFRGELADSRPQLTIEPERLCHWAVSGEQAEAVGLIDATVNETDLPTFKYE